MPTLKETLDLLSEWITFLLFLMVIAVIALSGLLIIVKYLMMFSKFLGL